MICCAFPLIFALLAVYTIVWTRKVMKLPLFQPVPVPKVMAMENEMYRFVRKQRKKMPTETASETAEL